MDAPQPPPPTVDKEAKKIAAEARETAERDQTNAAQERSAQMTRNMLLRFGTRAALSSTGASI